MSKATAIPIEDRELPAQQRDAIRELPSYWRLLRTAADRPTLLARIRAVVLLAEGLERRIAGLNARCHQLRADYELLLEENAKLKRKLVRVRVDRRYRTKKKQEHVLDLADRQADAILKGVKREVERI